MKLLRTGLITAVLAVAPSYLVAQEASTSPAPTEAPAAPSEAQQIQARLGQIQQQAMQDTAVQSAAAEITTAMETADPEFKALSERAKTLRTDVEAAKAAADNAKLRELAAEATQLQTNVAAARARAIANPEVQKKIEAYKVQLFQRMSQIDPEAQQLVARLAELKK